MEIGSEVEGEVEMRKERWGRMGEDEFREGESECV